MSIQLLLTDEHKVAHPQAYAVLASGGWKRNSGGFQLQVDVYASKAAMDAGGTPVLTFDKFVAYDSTAMTGLIEQAIMADPLIAAGNPTQVP